MSDPSYNYSYTPTVDHRESNLFREEYYSSTDTQIYFDDTMQTEIGFIQYEIQEQLKPVYGYNSRTFDDIVIGNRIVVGQFSMPIKNKEKQLFEVESEYADKPNDNGNDFFNRQEEEKLYDTDWFGSTAKNIKNINDYSPDPEYMAKLIAIGKYNISTYSSNEQFRQAIMKFQQDHKCSVTGVLNEQTKTKIDMEFMTMSAEEISLYDKKGYSNPETLKNGKTLDGTGLVLQRMRVNNNNVIYVLANDGKKYYILE